MTALTAWPEGVWDPEITALADAVVGEWLRIDSIWEAIRVRRGIHLRRDASSANPAEFLAEALAVARERNLLGAFAGELIKEGLVHPDFQECLDAVLGPSASELQVFKNGAFAPVPALVAGVGLLRACEYVCRIDVDGQHAGTGVLVHPRLVATAAHVVWDLIAKQANGSAALSADGSLQAAPDSVGQLTLTFGYIEDYLPESDGTYPVFKGEVAPPHENWLAWGSPPGQNEHPRLSAVTDISGIDKTQGPWDLALIRLAAPRALTGQTLFAEAQSKPFWINILHHPTSGTDRGEPLLWSVGKLDRRLGRPPVRFLHNANTLPGSSGAPIFDKGWRIVALHQGGDRVLQRYTEARPSADASRNRAVPIGHWCERLDAIEQALSSQEVVYVRELRGSPGLVPDPYPVIGRRETQRRLWRALQPGAASQDRLLIVRGQPGSGLRFTKRLVRELVTAHGGLVAALDMVNMLREDAIGFVQQVAGTLSRQASASLSAGLDIGLTTAQRDIRAGVAPTLGRELERLAGGRALFLVLEGFGEAWLDDPPAVRELLVNLIQRLGEFPSLRLVLVGWLEDPPAGFEVSVEDLSFPTAEDVAYYFTPAGQEPSEQQVTAIQGQLQAASRRGVADYAAAQEVISLLTPFLLPALRGISTPGAGSRS
jgi:Trypsin-like peptidase domain